MNLIYNYFIPNKKLLIFIYHRNYTFLIFRLIFDISIHVYFNSLFITDLMLIWLFVWWLWRVVWQNSKKTCPLISMTRTLHHQILLLLIISFEACNSLILHLASINVSTFTELLLFIFIIYIKLQYYKLLQCFIFCDLKNVFILIYF